MTDRPLIIVASAIPALTSALRASVPGFDFVEAASIEPDCETQRPVSCFVDWLLPDTSGLEMCRRLRSSAATRDAHITLAVDEDSAEARSRAMRSGADDYMVGPLEVERLLARLRLYPSPTVHAYPRHTSHRGLTLDRAAHGVRWQGQLIALAPNEFRLLAHFIDNPDRLFSRSQVIAVLGKDCEVSDARTVDVWIGRLRRALRQQGVPNALRTVRSMGYVMDSAACIAH